MTSRNPYLMFCSPVTERILRMFKHKYSPQTRDQGSEQQCTPHFAAIGSAESAVMVDDIVRCCILNIASLQCSTHDQQSSVLQVLVGVCGHAQRAPEQGCSMPGAQGTEAGLFCCWGCGGTGGGGCVIKMLHHHYQDTRSQPAGRSIFTNFIHFLLFTRIFGCLNYYHKTHAHGE